MVDGHDVRFTAAESFAEVQDENGIDLAHLRQNLKLTPTERVEKLRAYLEFLQEVHRAADAAGLRRTY